MQTPAVGSKVVVKVKYNHGPAMIPPRPGEIVYEGTVLKPYSWLSDREFCLSGDQTWPTRVISLNHIIGITLLSGKMNPVNSNEKKWKVAGSKGNFYTVIRNSKKWSCTCPGFTFRQNCKHVANLSITQ